jgi:hypothetical protein
MVKQLWVFVSMVIMLSFLCEKIAAQEVEADKAKSWSLSGRVQLQHLYDNSLDADEAATNNGFRMRRTRLQVKAKLNDWLSGKIQMEVRDNAPSLKDAEAKLKLFDKYAIRLGQFKVPVWREELRSSGSLFLVERSEAAGFLDMYYLSARNIGIEFNGAYKNGLSFALNYSNGSGEGIREDAGRSKYRVSHDTLFTALQSPNNGKLFTGRINYAIKEVAEIGLSIALNQLGNQVASLDLDNRGNVYAVAPDFGVYLPLGLDIEGGLAFGKISGDLLSGSSTGSVNMNFDDRSFNLADVTALWKKSLAGPVQQLGGLDGYGFAAGVSYIEPDTDTSDDEMINFRFGPVIYFGSQFKLQINGEVESYTDPDMDSVFKIRSQVTLNL